MLVAVSRIQGSAKINKKWCQKSELIANIRNMSCFECAVNPFGEVEYEELVRSYSGVNDVF
jgi:hypothetical protein